MTQSIFRPDAVEHRSPSTLGRIIIARPLTLSVLCWFIFAGMLACALFLYRGTYSPRVTAQGLVMPDIGVSRVESPMPGVVRHRFVNEGQIVKKDDPLFEMISEGRGRPASRTQEVISQNIEQRLELFEGELSRLKLLHVQLLAEADRQIADFKSEAESISEQLKLQEARVALIKDSAARYDELHTKNFISREHLQSKLAEEIDAVGKRGELKRELAKTRAKLMNSISERESLPLKQASEVDRLKRENSVARQDWEESEAKRKVTVSAPVSGTVTAVNYFVGQSIDTGRVLATIVPKSYKPQVQLYVPSRGFGHVRVGSEVSLRIQAFPYQRYGSIRARVVATSKAILTPSDLASLGISLPLPNNEGVYRVTVDLQEESRYIPVSALKVGMSVEGDILDERRRLYQWIAEPLRGISSRL